MGYKIPSEVWRIVEIKIRRYPENRAEYENIVDTIMNCNQGNDGQPRERSIASTTERVAIKLSEDVRLQRIKREIDAVENTYNELPQEHKKVIRIRFWSYRYQNMRYFDMERCTSYSDRQMKRIIAKFIRKVGERLGEV